MTEQAQPFGVNAAVQHGGCVPLQVLPFGGVRPSPVFPELVSRYRQCPAASTPTTASADSPPSCPGGVSPGKNALLPSATAAFSSRGGSAFGGTSATEPATSQCGARSSHRGRPYYAVLVHRPAGFLYPSSPRSVTLSELASSGSSFTFSRAVLLQGTCTPFTTRPCWAHTNACTLRRVPRRK